MKAFFQKIVQIFQQERKRESTENTSSVQNQIVEPIGDLSINDLKIAIDSSNENITILNDVFTVIIQDIPLEFSVKFTTYGEVLAVQCLLLQLPETAQKLMLGKIALNSYFKAEIEQAKKYLASIIPLAKANLVDIPQLKKHAAWQRVSLSDAIDYYQYSSKDIKLFTLYRAVETNDIDTAITMPSITNFIEDGDALFTFFHANRKKTHTLHPLVIRSIFHRLGFRSINKALKLFQKQPSENVQKYLLGYLNDQKYSRHRCRILSTLVPPKSKIVHTALIDFYHRNNYLPPEDFRLIIKGLGAYQTKESEEIIWTLLKRFVADYSSFALQVLLDWHTPTTQILDLIKETIRSSKKPQKVLLAYQLSAQIDSNSELDLNWLQTNLIDNRKAHPHIFFKQTSIINYHYPKRLNVDKKTLTEMFYQYLHHADSNYIKLGLAGLNTEIALTNLSRSKEEFLKTILGLLTHQDVRIKIATLSFIASTNKYFDYVPYLASFIKMACKKNSRVRFQAVKILNTLNRNQTVGKFNDKLKDIYIKRLKDEDKEVRIAAIQGVTLYTDLDIYTQLKQLDPNYQEAVRLPYYYMRAYYQPTLKSTLTSMQQRLEKIHGKNHPAFKS